MVSVFAIKVRTGAISRHGRRAIEIHVESEAVRLQIQIYQRFDGKPILENAHFDIVEGRRGQGIGAGAFGRQVEQARRLGVAEIQGYAARDDRIGDLGYLVWPLLGFDAILPRVMLDKLPRHLSRARKVCDMVKTVEGRQWWREHGDSIAVSFNLVPRSRSVRWLRAYFRRKGLS